VVSVSITKFALDIRSTDWNFRDKFQKDPKSEQIQDLVVFGWCVENVVLFGNVYNEEEYI